MDKATKARQRLATDFTYYCAHCVKIRTKDGQTLPLLLNRAQKRLLKLMLRQLHDEGRIRIIVCKARQMGFTTLVQAFIYWWTSHRKGTQAIVVAHKADNARAIFDGYQRIHKAMPVLPPNLVPLRPSTSYSGRKELVFDQLDSGIAVATAGGDSGSLGRGMTIQAAHLSEQAFWPETSADENFAALDQAIPRDGSIVIIESTPFGMGNNLFYRMYQGAGEVIAQPGTNGYVRFFAPWFESDEYREKAPADFERTYEEQDLVDKYGLDNDQLQFRRTKIANIGREQFLQEFASDDVSCFLASGAQVFDADLLHKRLREIEKQPIHKRMRLSPTDDNVFEDSPWGDLTLFKPVDGHDLYTIGADIALGVKNGDYSVAQVLNSKGEQVAIYRGHCDPERFATILSALGTLYTGNTKEPARLAVENNSYGLVTAVALKNMHYRNLYTDVREGDLNDRDTIRIGINTNPATKKLIIGRLIAALRDNEIEINCPETLKEMLSFKVTSANGAMEAESGMHDDTVIALAIANHVLERSFTPVEMPDHLYVTALPAF